MYTHCISRYIHTYGHVAPTGSSHLPKMMGLQAEKQAMQSHLSISYDPWMDHPLPMTFLQGVRTASSLSRCSSEPFGIAVGGPTQKGRVYHFDDRWCFLSENIFWLRWWYWMTLIWIQHVMYESAVIIRQCSVAPCGRMQPKCTEFLGFLAGGQAAYRSLGLPCKFGMGWGWYNCGYGSKLVPLKQGDD